MLTSNELRLGNIVRVNNTVGEISMISNTYVHVLTENANGHTDTEHQFKELNEVPLTDEVLEQYGFSFHHYFKFWQRVSTGIRSEMDIDRDYNVIDFMRRPIMKKLVSLHQLQNIFFMLKGRELKENAQYKILQDANA